MITTLSNRLIARLGALEAKPVWGTAADTILDHVPFRRPIASPDDPHDSVAARAAAIAVLARRDYACGELRLKLASRGFAVEAIEAVMAALRSEGVLNDERFAQNYVAHHAARGQGPLRIRAELRRLELAAGTIEAALEGGPDWHALASKVCRSKFGAQAPTQWSQKSRQARFLHYRGFSADHIRAAVGAEPDPD
jgi:regulatory protein